MKQFDIKFYDTDEFRLVVPEANRHLKTITR